MPSSVLDGGIRSERQPIPCIQRPPRKLHILGKSIVLVPPSQCQENGTPDRNIIAPRIGQVVRQPVESISWDGWISPFSGILGIYRHLIKGTTCKVRILEGVDQSGDPTRAHHIIGICEENRLTASLPGANVTGVADAPNVRRNPPREGP